MSKSTATATQPKARRPELSPDLSEVLHMLKSLENQKPAGGPAQ